LRAVLDSLPSVHGDNDAITLDAIELLDTESSDFSGSDASFSESMSLSMSESFSGESGSFFSFSDELSFSELFSFSESGLFSDFSGSEPPVSFSFSESGSGSGEESFSFSDFSASDFSGSGASMSLSGDGMTCFPNPCEHGGTCEYDLDNDRVTCECTFEWDGDFCESPAAPSVINDLVLVRGSPSSSALIAKWLPVTKGDDVHYTLHFGLPGSEAPIVISDSEIVAGKYVVEQASLLPNTEYSAYVVAANSIGSTTSNTATKFTTPVGPTTMDAPTILHASAYWIDIQWSAPTFPDTSAIAAYFIKFTGWAANDTQVINVTDSSATWYRVKNADGSSLSLGDTYQFTIAALDTAGVFGEDSDWSDEATTALGAPWGLSNLTVTARALDSLSLSWSEPWDLNSETLADTVFYFALTSTVGGDTVTVSAEVDGVLAADITGLKSGREYHITYYASNDNGDSDVNDHVLTTKLPVTPPKILSFKAADSTTTPVAGLTSGDTVTITFDKATNQPALTSANIANYISFSIASTATMTPSWTSPSVLKITLSGTPAGFTLGKVTVTVGGGSIALEAAATLGGSAAASSTSTPLSGNFGFASTLLTLLPLSTTPEDTAATFGSSGISATLLAPGSLPGSITVRIQPYVAGSTLTSIVAGVTSTGTSTTELVLTGTLASLVSVFSAITYTPPTDFNGNDIITVSFENGGTQVYFDAISIDVTAVNDAPVLAVASLTTSQSVDSEFTITGTTVTDVDSVLNADAAVTASVVTSDELHTCRFGSSVAGVVFSPAFVSGSQPLRQKVTAYGKVAAVNTALNSIKCSFGLADPTDISSPMISITINDGANGADSDDTTTVPAVAGQDIGVTVSCAAATLTAPTLIFSDDATAILIVWPKSVIISTPDAQACDNWFDSASLTALGSGAECYGVGLENGRNTIQAVLGKGSSISPGGSLTLKAFSRCTGSVSFTAGAVTVAAPTSPVKPTIAVDAPSQVAQCGQFSMQAFAAGVSDRTATYAWSSLPAALLSGLSVADLTKSSITVPSNAPEATYTVTVRVTNFVGAESLDSVFTVQVINKFLADIRVTGPRTGTPSVSGSLTWRAAAELPACSSLPSLAFNFVWSSSSTTVQSYLASNGLTSGTTLIVPANQFLTLGTYDITVVGTQTDDSTNVATTTLTYTVAFAAPTLASTGYVSAFTSAVTSFAWSVSSFRSSSYGVTSRSIITCRAPGGVQCVSTSGVAKYPLTPSTSTAILALLNGAGATVGAYDAMSASALLAANSMAPGSYTFTLFVSYSALSGKYSTSNVVVVYAPPPTVTSGRRLLATTISGKPIITLTCNKGCSGIASPPIVSAGQLLAFGVDAVVQAGTPSTITSTAYTWEITPTPRGGLSGVVSNTQYFTLNPNSVSNYFVQGATYNIAVTVQLTLANGATQSGTVYQQIQVNQPPRSGSLSVPTSNSEGVAIILQAPGWFDSNGGLQYQFFTRDSNGVRRDISSVSSSPRFVWEYPLAGTGATNSRTVGVAVNDALGATTLSESQVSIIPRTFTTATTAPYVSTQTSTQTAKGNTEGLNALSVQVGNGISSVLSNDDASSVRATLLANIASAASTTSPSAFAATVQVAIGSSSGQITVATAVAACSELSAALATLDGNTRSSLAISTVNTATSVGNAILVAVAANAPVSGRRLLAAGSDTESTKASVNATYSMLLYTLQTASVSILVNPGHIWEQTLSNVDSMAYRFKPAAAALSISTTTLSVGGVPSTVSVAADAGISSVTIIDLHVIYASPNLFYSTSQTIIGASVLVRYADTQGVALSSLDAGKTTTVTIPFQASLCPQSSCTPTCVMWSNNDWTETGVTSLSGSTSTTAQCQVASSVGSKFQVSLKYKAGAVVTPTSSSSSSTGGTGITSIQAAIIINKVLTDLPAAATFAAAFIDELATVVGGTDKASYISRFSVTATAAASTSATKVSFSITDSLTGKTAQGIYNDLAAAIKAGTATSTYLSLAQSIVMTCSDNVERATCDTSPGDGGSSSMGGIIGGVVGGVAFIIIVVVAVICYRKSRPPKIHDSSAHGATSDPSAAAVA
jgi:hypothetical protein